MPMSAAAPARARVPVPPVRELCRATAALGVDVDAALAEAGCSRSALEGQDGAPAAALGGAALQAFVQGLLRHAARPTLALEAGVAAERPAALAAAMDAAATPRAALAAWLRHGAARQTFVHWELRAAEGGAWLLGEPAVDGAALRGFVLDHGAGVVGGWLLRCGAAAQAQLELPWQAPPWQALYRRLAGDVRFGRGRLAFWLPDALLDRPRPGHCPARAEAALSALSALDAAGEDATGENAPDGLDTAARVRALLARRDPALHAADAMAAALGLCRRTLARRLAAEGSGFQALLDAWRRAECERLLRETSLPVADIARGLGFRDSSNFSRHVRRWTGATPSRLREHEASGTEG